MKTVSFPAAIIIITLVFIAGCIAIKPTERIEFQAADSYPEGIAFDGNNYFVSSARTSAVGKVSREGAYNVLFYDSSFKSSYGMKVHPDGKRLFVCISDANYSKFTDPQTRNKLAKLIVLDIASGKKMQEIDLSGLKEGKHFINDLTFDNNGNCYVTDSYAHAIYKIDAEGKASLFAADKMFVTEGIGLNGIVFHPSGFLIVDNTNTGTLYKVKINDPKDVKKVKINQFFLGADGMLLKDSTTLVIVVNGNNDKIYELNSEDQWQSAEMKGTTLIADRFTYPSTAAFANNEVWIMNAKFNELVDSNAVPSKTFAIQRAVFKPIPKKLRN